MSARARGHGEGDGRGRRGEGGRGAGGQGGRGAGETGDTQFHTLVGIVSSWTKSNELTIVLGTKERESVDWNVSGYARRASSIMTIQKRATLRRFALFGGVWFYSTCRAHQRHSLRSMRCCFGRIDISCVFIVLDFE